MPVKSRAQVFDNAAYYQIAFHGEISAEFAESMHGMEAEVVTSSDGSRLTVLSGWLRDQAALAGVLSTAYNMGIPLLSVQRLAQGAPE
jgi:hypothetical protein